MEQEEIIKYITEKEASVIIGRSVSALQNDRNTNRGVPYYKLRGSVKYTVQDIVAHMETKKVIPKNK